MTNKILWILTAAITAALPSILVKKYILTKKMVWIVMAIISYLILITAYTVLLVNNNLAIIYPLLNAFNVMIVVGTGIIIYNDKIGTCEIIGIILLLVSIYLLARKSNVTK